ncbi:hypothetical protein BDV23DRAFT_147995 [Aspergillus alliaceus]|uniref:Uncharacterized protein n=1 Tax=Petromyces alliaceus TaxID=209559 RepID=A0A5N7CIY4_PETAA|nr:hypothetical protein BDV23DRAFT_147995 [Aspergillus alliaceus]
MSMAHSSLTLISYCHCNNGKCHERVAMQNSLLRTTLFIMILTVALAYVSPSHGWRFSGTDNFYPWVIPVPEPTTTQ